MKLNEIHTDGAKTGIGALNYRIAETLQGRKLLCFGTNDNFAEKTVADCSGPIIM